jgi:hypothetical protein
MKPKSKNWEPILKGGILGFEISCNYLLAGDVV